MAFPGFFEDLKSLPIRNIAKPVVVIHQSSIVVPARIEECAGQAVKVSITSLDRKPLIETHHVKNRRHHGSALAPARRRREKVE